MHEYTQAQREYIVKNVKGRYVGELTNMFNENFGTKLEPKQISAYKKNNKLNSGLDAKFKKGNAPYNKGQKGVGGWEPTQFKKGNKPHNYMPVGSERINADDYVDIKIADPNKWKGKHIIIWEEHNGTIPKGHVIIFGDRNNRNFVPSNLICLSRQQLLILNKNNLIQNDTDLTKTAVIIADIKLRSSQRKKSR